MNTQELKQTRLLWSTRSENNDRWYVYLYIDPLNKTVFYVGVGQKNRVFDHLSETSETEKVRRIEEIRKRGLEPDIDILADNLDRDTALRIESAIIAVLGIDKLTNIQVGHNPQRCSIGKSLRIREAAVIKHNVVVIIINKLFPIYFPEGVYDPYNIEHNDSLFSISRMMWKLNHNKIKEVQYILPSYHGTILDVFEIDNTRFNGVIRVGDAYKQGLFSLADEGKYYLDGDKYRAIDINDIDGTVNRSILFGTIAQEEIRELYRNKYLKTESKGNPIKYFFK